MLRTLEGDSQNRIIELLDAFSPETSAAELRGIYLVMEKADFTLDFVLKCKKKQNMPLNEVSLCHLTASVLPFLNNPWLPTIGDDSLVDVPTAPRSSIPPQCRYVLLRPLSEPRRSPHRNGLLYVFFLRSRCGSSRFEAE